MDIMIIVSLNGTITLPIGGFFTVFLDNVLTETVPYEDVLIENDTATLVGLPDVIGIIKVENDLPFNIGGDVTNLSDFEFTINANVLYGTIIPPLGNIYSDNSYNFTINTNSVISKWNSDGDLNVIFDNDIGNSVNVSFRNDTNVTVSYNLTCEIKDQFNNIKYINYSVKVSNSKELVIGYNEITNHSVTEVKKLDFNLSDVIISKGIDVSTNEITLTQSDYIVKFKGHIDSINSVKLYLNIDDVPIFDVSSLANVTLPISFLGVNKKLSISADYVSLIDNNISYILDIKEVIQ